MLLNIYLMVTLLLLLYPFDNLASTEKPHIIFIVADDLGWNDVGFHGSNQIPTPNIDALAYSGVILNNYYVQPICTPSRSAIMTGYHPIHTGLQVHTIGGPHPYGLPLHFTTLPQFLNKLDYLSRHVGKWHLGCYKRTFTPTFRGFESHFGYWTGRIDYYDHTAYENPGWWGYDMRRNMEVARDAYGKYTTDLFTNEAVNVISKHNASKPLFLYLAHLAVHSANPHDSLQAPYDIVQKFSYIKDIKRRKFAAMLWKLDDSIGKTVKALKETGMLSNSIIIFTTDNGGPAGGFNQNAASNWPLRGVKASMWEGGIRGAGLVWSPLISNPGRVSNAMFHITDWLPTLYSAAGGSTKDLGAIDGKNFWSTIAHNDGTSRKEFLINYDPVINGAGMRYGDFKLIYNPSYFGHQWDGWFGPSGRNVSTEETKKLIEESDSGEAIRSIYTNAFHNIENIRKDASVSCSPIPHDATEYCNNTDLPCLFNIRLDPCEYHDVSHQNPGIMSIMTKLLNEYIASAVKPLNTDWDPAANPKYWDYTWTNWKDYQSPLMIK